MYTKLFLNYKICAYIWNMSIAGKLDASFSQISLRLVDTVYAIFFHGYLCNINYTSAIFTYFSFLTTFLNSSIAEISGPIGYPVLRAVWLKRIIAENKFLLRRHYVKRKRNVSFFTLVFSKCLVWASVRVMSQVDYYILALAMHARTGNTRQRWQHTGFLSWHTAVFGRSITCSFLTTYLYILIAITDDIPLSTAAMAWRNYSNSPWQCNVQLQHNIKYT